MVEGPAQGCAASNAVAQLRRLLRLLVDPGEQLRQAERGGDDQPGQHQGDQHLDQGEAGIAARPGGHGGSPAARRVASWTDGPRRGVTRTMTENRPGWPATSDNPSSRQVAMASDQALPSPRRPDTLRG